jgi:hypothetical protein
MTPVEQQWIRDIATKVSEVNALLMQKGSLSIQDHGRAIALTLITKFELEHLANKPTTQE